MRGMASLSRRGNFGTGAYRPDAADDTVPVRACPQAALRLALERATDKAILEPLLYRRTAARIIAPQRHAVDGDRRPVDGQCSGLASQIRRQDAIGFTLIQKDRQLRPRGRSTQHVPDQDDVRFAIAIEIGDRVLSCHRAALRVLLRGEELGDHALRAILVKRMRGGRQHK